MIDWQLRVFQTRMCLYGIIAVVMLGVLLLPLKARALEQVEVTASSRASIPTEAAKYKRELVRQARLVWGLSAPVATFAAQIHQESAWNPNARSAVGATGLAQFMPTTAKWVSEAYDDLRENAPTSPAWAMRALVQYDRWLLDRVTGADDCNSAAKMLSAYNGGLAWVARDEGAALKKGLWPEYWWGSVETVNAGRGDAFWRENRGYPRVILKHHEPLYVAAGWGYGLCEGP